MVVWMPELLSELYGTLIVMVALALAQLSMRSKAVGFVIKAIRDFRACAEKPQSLSGAENTSAARQHNQVGGF